MNGGGSGKLMGADPTLLVFFERDGGDAGITSTSPALMLFV